MQLSSTDATKLLWSWRLSAFREFLSGGIDAVLVANPEQEAWVLENADKTFDDVFDMAGAATSK